MSTITTTDRKPGRGGRRAGSGRKRKTVQEAQLDRIRRMAGYGLNQDQIARELDMSPSTFKARRKDQPDVQDLLDEGKATAAHEVGKTLFNKAKRGDTTAIIWFEKTRLGYSDRMALVDAIPRGEFTRLMQAVSAVVEEHVTDGDVLERIREGWARIQPV